MNRNEKLALAKLWLTNNKDEYINDPDCDVDWRYYLAQDCLGELDIFQFDDESQGIVEEALKALGL